MGKTWKQGLEPTRETESDRVKVRDRESGCGLLKFPVKERRNRGNQDDWRVPE